MATLAPTKPKTLRRSEVAELLGVHPNTVMSWASRGWLETVELPGGEKRYLEESVHALRRKIYGS
jgi:predicted site-specific integrase-resolvase